MFPSYKVEKWLQQLIVQVIIRHVDYRKSFLYDYFDLLLIYDRSFLYRATGDSLYIILGIEKSAAPEDIKRSYRKV